MSTCSLEDRTLKFISFFREKYVEDNFEELRKLHLDLILYGNCMSETNNKTGKIKHIPIEDHPCFDPGLCNCEKCLEEREKFYDDRYVKRS